jgi:hypothetical protein
VRVARSAGRFLLPRSHLVHAIFISIFLYFYFCSAVSYDSPIETDAVFVVAQNTAH